MFHDYETAAADRALFDQNLDAIIRQLTVHHEFPLSRADQTSIAYVYTAFFHAGPQLNYGVAGSPIGSMPAYSELMTETDRLGVNRSYLASEDNFRIVKHLEENNLVVPVTGNFAGPKAVREVGRYLAAHHAPVTAFYLSNVERYLFEQIGSWQRFYVNVAVLPYDSQSMFIRSVLSGTYRSSSVLSTIDGVMNAFGEGKIVTYDDILALSN
jgi:hypothetical protein